MNVEELLNFDLSKEVVKVLKDEGVKTLFEPQEIAVNQGILSLEDSFLISVPTASGKTLIAELVMVRAILAQRERRKGAAKCLYIVPLKALASEKYESFKKWEKLGIRVGISTGDLDSTDPWLARYDIVIATSEKVDSLTRHNTDWLKDVSVLVVDEVHLVHDSRRGPTLEVVIARLRHIQPSLLILALSATVQNAGEIAAWLDARLLESSWRPVELREGVYYNQAVLFDNSQTIDIDVQGEKSKDAAMSLAIDSVKEGGQCLVFLNTRRSVESFADDLDLTKTITEEEKERLITLSEGILNSLPEPTKTCKRLARCVIKGVAFHHAGLVSEQRRLVEKGYKDNIIKVISATPTLAAGVNLPARRVVVKDYQRYDVNLGRVEIPVIEYKQMAGRAGRPGYDSYGEAILISKTEAEKDFLLDNYVLAAPEEIYSKLAIEGSLRTHVLATIASNFANSVFTLIEFFSKTLFAFQRDVLALEDMLEKIVDFLVDEKMVERKNETLMSTPFGRRVSQLYIDPQTAVSLRNALFEAEKHETQDFSYLHAITNTAELGGLYLRRGDDKKFQSKLYEHMPYLLYQTEDLNIWEHEGLLSEIKMASFLQDWINEYSDEEVREEYALAAGDIRSRVELSKWILYSMKEIGRLFKSSKIGEIKKLETRLKYGVKEELLELVSLNGVGRVRARMLYGRGYKNLEDIKKAGVTKLAMVESIGKKLATSIIEQLQG